MTRYYTARLTRVAVIIMLVAVLAFDIVANNLVMLAVHLACMGAGFLVGRYL